MNASTVMPKLGAGQGLEHRRDVDAWVDFVLDRLARLPVGVAAGGHSEGERLRGHTGDGGAGEADCSHRRGGRTRL